MNVMFIVAHPDDEVLGCGGTIAKHVKNGDEVHVLILAEGLTSRDQQRELEKRSAELSQLALSAQEANNILGVHSLMLNDFPDNRMDSIDLLDIVKVIESALDNFKADIIYTHHAEDLNIDHRIVHQAVVTASRPLPGHSMKTILFFEVPSSTEWQTPGSAPALLPNYFVDISQTLDLKMKALALGRNEALAPSAFFKGDRIPGSLAGNYCRRRGSGSLRFGQKNRLSFLNKEHLHGKPDCFQ